jgi:hypothetical protein
VLQRRGQQARPEAHSNAAKPRVCCPEVNLFSTPRIYITMTLGIFPNSFKVAGMIALTSVCLSLTQGTIVAGPPIPAPAATAAITEANYCFDRVRGLDPGRLPPAMPELAP